MAAKCSTALAAGSLSCLAVVSFSACGRLDEPAADALVLDLVDAIDTAEVVSETRHLDIGTPSARSFLSGSWSWNERDGEGNSFAWTGIESAEVAFFLARDRPTSARFRCLPYSGPDGSVTAMTATLNGTEIARIGLRQGWQEYELELPAERVEPGINRLRFAPHLSAEPEGTKPRPKAGRRVTVAWDWITFAGEEVEPPSAEPQSGLLRLPSGTRVDYFLAAPADSELTIETITQQGERPGTLRVTALQDGQVPHTMLEFTGWQLGEPVSGGRQRYRSLPLKPPINRWSLGAMPGLVRLRLESTGTFDLTAPRIVSSSPQSAGRQALAPERGSRRPVEPPLVLLYVFDAFRADHLDSFSLTDSRTPGLAALALDSVVFENAQAQSSWTKPTVASIITGRHPWAHGARDARDMLPRDLDTLPVLMQQLGYTTVAFSANGFVSRMFGFDRGFDSFALMPDIDAPSSKVHRLALEWLTENRDQRVFLYLHTIDPHTPYAPAEPFRSRYLPGVVDPAIGSVPFMEDLAHSRRRPEPAELEAISSLYSAEVAFADQQLSQLIAGLEALELYDASLIVVVADHGEELFEHGKWTHGQTLYPEVLHVPLLIKFPGGWGAGARVSDRVQQIDLLPTFEELFGVSRSTPLPGSSLVCSVEQIVSGEDLDCATASSRPIFASVDYYNNHWIGVTLDDWKLILPSTPRLTGDARLFDLRTDREALDNVADHFPVRVGHLSSLIRQELARQTGRAAPEQAQLDPETESRLKALGYLE